MDRIEYFTSCFSYEHVKTLLFTFDGVVDAVAEFEAIVTDLTDRAVHGE